MDLRQFFLLLLTLPGLLLTQGGQYTVCFCGPASECCASVPADDSAGALPRGDFAAETGSCCSTSKSDDSPGEGPLAESDPCGGCHHIDVTDLDFEVGTSVQPGPSGVTLASHTESPLPPTTRPILVACIRPPPGRTRPLALRRGVMPMRI